MKEEYERDLLGGPWKIGDNYLHTQRWRPNLRAEKAEINSLPVWVRIPVLLVELYYERLLKEGNHSGQTVKANMAKQLASRGKFARGCVEVDL